MVRKISGRIICEISGGNPASRCSWWVSREICWGIFTEGISVRIAVGIPRVCPRGIPEAFLEKKIADSAKRNSWRNQWRNLWRYSLRTPHMPDDVDFSKNSCWDCLKIYPRIHFKSFKNSYTNIIDFFKDFLWISFDMPAEVPAGIPW